MTAHVNILKTETLYFFVAEYHHSMKVHEGGGIEHEQENIEVLELPVAKAMEIRSKKG